MSHAGMFEGLDMPLSESSTRYSPGAPVPSENRRENPLAQEMVQMYVKNHPSVVLQTELNNPDILRSFKVFADYFTTLIKSQGRNTLDPDELLEDIVSEVFWERDPFLMGKCGGLIDASIQALYNSGYNDFTLDLSDFDVDSLCCNLKGRAWRPLRVQCEGTVQEDFGRGVRYCHLVLHGYSGHLGRKSRNSEVQQCRGGTWQEVLP